MGAPFEHTGPEHITRGEFQNVIGSLNQRFDNLDDRWEELKTWMEEMNKQVSPVFAEYQERKAEVTDKREDKRDNKLAIIGFFSSVASMIVAGVALVLLGQKN